MSLGSSESKSVLPASSLLSALLCVRSPRRALSVAAPAAIFLAVTLSHRDRLLHVWNWKPNKLFLPEVVLAVVFSPSNRRVTNTH